MSISTSRQRENDIRLLESYRKQFNLQRRLRRLEPWYRVRRPMEAMYKQELRNWSQTEGKKIIRIVNHPKNKVNLNYLYYTQEELLLRGLIKNLRGTASKVSIRGEVEKLMQSLDDWGTYFKAKGEEIGETFANTIYKTATEYVLNTTKEEVSKTVIDDIKANPNTELIDQMLEARTYPAMSNVLAQYDDAVRGIVEQGLEQGRTAEEISSDLQGFINFHGEYYPEYIYDRIARNETSRFSNEAKIDAWLQLGIEEYDWIQGPGPCNEAMICERMANGGPYKTGEGPMPIDDTHVNCLCEIEEHIPTQQGE